MERPQGPAWVKHSLETETYRDKQKGVIDPMTATKKSTTIIVKYWGNGFLLHCILCEIRGFEIHTLGTYGFLTNREIKCLV